MNLAVEPLSKFRRTQIASKFFLNNIKKKIENKKNCSISSHLLPFYDIALFATTDKSIYKKPFILRLDGIYIDKKNTIKDSILENKKIFKSIENSSGVIFNSKYSKKIVETLYKKIEKPNIVISNGSDQTIFKPEGNNLREKLGIEKDEIVLITCAYWRRHKRLKETIIFFNKLVKKRNEKLRLIVIGAEKKDIRNNENIIYSGQIRNQELPQWYRTADIYIHLSWIEANANSQCEAISCGLPVLCSNNGGNHETVTNLKAGIVSKCDQEFNYEMIDLYNPPEPDYNILINDMDKLIKDKKKYQSNNLIKEISLDNISNKYFEFITKVFKSI
jgi:glycosyltransferase involved in cell wall biosynthesis